MGSAGSTKAMFLEHHSERHVRARGILRGVYEGRRKIATVGAVVLAAIVGFHVVLGQNGLTAYRNKRQTIRDLDAEMRELEVKNRILRGHVERLGSDPNAIEHEARESLHYTRPGEIIYTLPEAGKQ